MRTVQWALLRAYAVLLALLATSGTVPPPVEVTGWEPDDGALVRRESQVSPC